MNAVKPTGFFPVLTTDKLSECRDFYVDQFGFRIVFETDWYVHLLSEAGIQLAFLEPAHPSQPAFLHGAYSGEGVIYSFDVEDADQEYRKLEAAGIEIVYEITSENWGQRHFMIRDPSGMIVDIVQTVDSKGI